MKKDQTSRPDTIVRHIGYDILGPVVHRWLLGLEQYVSYFDDGKTSFLYCARAGVRIQRLFELYLTGKGHSLNDRHTLFWISRLLVCKGTIGRNAESAKAAAKVIAGEFYHQPLRNLVRAMLRNTDLLTEEDEELLKGTDLDAYGFNFPGWIRSDKPLAQRLRAYFESCSASFDAHFKALVEGSDRVVLIDSGWRGTSQALLRRAYPELTWKGLYVGRILTGDYDREVVDDLIGILFQAETYDPARPETAIVLHRHVIEELLEPNGPSVEEVVGGPHDAAAQAQIQANLNEKVLPSRDALFLLVEEYLRDNAGLGPAEIIARHQAAIPELARLLSEPTAEEALAIESKERSADFGKDLMVPVLLVDPDPDDPRHATADTRIRHSLWPQGQIALEYKGGIRRELQRRASGLSDDLQHFDPAMEADASESQVEAHLPRQASVAIITRTKNRPILLRRAAESVARQTYQNYLWVVVNDGGDEDAVREVIEASAVDRRRIRLVSNATSLGMEAASNAGIRSVDSDYIVIHDDDDSLHPDFLRSTVSYLESKAGSRYGGVVTASEYVSEEIRGDQVIEHGRQPFKDWVRNIQLSEMLANNTFPPIAFLYRREIYDRIGGYEPTLPVLGDWFFNLEFLVHSDIKFLPRVLAYYHHRDRGDSSRQGIYANSVTGGQSKHEEFASVARNMFMRKYSGSAIAAGAISAYFAEDSRARFDGVSGRIDALPQNIEHQLRGLTSQLSQTERQHLSEIDRLWVRAQVVDFVKRAPKRLKNDEASKISLDIDLPALLNLALSLGIHLEPHPNFDETAYLEENPEVREAVASGMFTSGYMHYLLHGRNENRRRPQAG